MSQSWTRCEPDPKNSPEGAFGSLEKVFSLQGETVARSPISHVLRIAVQGRYYYVKRYTQAGKGLRRFLGRSRVRAEWENLNLFKRLGIPTPRLVAYGQEYRHGRFCRGALVTEELTGTVDLATLERDESPLLTDRRWMDQVLMQTAEYVRRLHGVRFIHTDLKWRNILVTPDDAPKVSFIDCPGGRIRWIDRSQRWYVKDIACLDKVAKYRLPPRQRMKFYHHYTGRRNLTAGDRRFIHRVLTYFEGRE